MHRFAIFALALLMMSCGGDSKKEKKEPVSIGASTQKTEKAAKPAKGVTFSEDGTEAMVDIEGDDSMKFNLKTIKVKEGQKVTLTLHHVGKMDIQVMGHNWVLLNQGVDMMDFGGRAASAEDNDYIPEGSEDEYIVHTKMIGGGETTTITFDAPEKGTYDFICSFPGHVAIMKGKFIVE